MANNSMDNLNIPEFETAFLFRKRPLSLSADLRPTWRVGLLVLLLSECCRGGKASLARLHVLSWGVRSQKSREDLLAAVNSELPPEALVVRFDPFLNRAIDFAIGESLLSRASGGKVALSAKGKELSEEIYSDKSIYIAERESIEKIGQKVTEGLVDRMFGWEK